MVLKFDIQKYNLGQLIQLISNLQRPYSKYLDLVGIGKSNIICIFLKNNSSDDAVSAVSGAHFEKHGSNYIATILEILIFSTKYN